MRIYWEDWRLHGYAEARWLRSLRASTNLLTAEPASPPEERRYENVALNGARSLAIDGVVLADRAQRWSPRHGAASLPAEIGTNFWVSF